MGTSLCGKLLMNVAQPQISSAGADKQLRNLVGVCRCTYIEVARMVLHAFCLEGKWIVSSGYDENNGLNASLVIYQGQFLMW